MKRVKHIVLIPVGPALRREFVLDTIDSVRHFTDPDRRIVVVDSRAADDPLQPDGDDIDIVVSPFGAGMGGILHFGVGTGTQFALDRYQFEVLLRLDDDSLIVGPRPEDAAIARFAAEPTLGMLGSFHKTCEGYVRDLSWAAGRLNEEMDDEYITRDATDDRSREARLKAARSLRDIYRRACAHGYVDGEHCLGAAVYFSHAALQSMRDAGMLGVRELLPSILGEDHLRGLLGRACGIEMAEFEQGDDPLCLDWLQLPCAPEQLVARGKKIVHSVKRWQHMDQAAIRDYFRQLRSDLPASH